MPDVREDYEFPLANEKLPQSVGNEGQGAYLVADTPRYLMVAFGPAHPPGPAPVVIQILNKRSRAWSVVNAPTENPRDGDPSIRIFGDWMATIVEEDIPGGWEMSRGQENERGYKVYQLYPGQLPNVWETYRQIASMPGILQLQNLAGHRQMSIDTGQQDSEVLDVSALERTLDAQSSAAGIPCLTLAATEWPRSSLEVPDSPQKAPGELPAQPNLYP